MTSQVATSHSPHDIYPPGSTNTQTLQLASLLYSQGNGGQRTQHLHQILQHRHRIPIPYECDEQLDVDHIIFLQ